MQGGSLLYALSYVLGWLGCILCSYLNHLSLLLFWSAGYALGVVHYLL
jgi:hypothetical protein